MKYKVKNGIYNLDFESSKLEQIIIDYCCKLLEHKGFQYLVIPTTITADTFFRQQIATDSWFLSAKEGLALGGSAEQGILQYFTAQNVEPIKIYSKNTCFRKEDVYEGLRRVKEFFKVEQYIFCEEKDWEENFELLLSNGIKVLEKFGIEFRIRDVTKEDLGYHIKKVDIEAWTDKYSWMETHSCTYFGTNQSKLYDITGANHTLSCTGIATPRVLIPLLEKLNN